MGPPFSFHAWGTLKALDELLGVRRERAKAGGALLGLDAAALYQDRGTMGQLLETFAYQELRRQASGHADEIRFHHFRDKDGYEVDIVLERGGRQVAGVEVKAAATLTGADFAGLRKLAAAAAGRFAWGVVLYDGEAVVSFGDRLHAVPISALWEKPTDRQGTLRRAVP